MFRDDGKKITDSAKGAGFRGANYKGLCGQRGCVNVYFAGVLYLFRRFGTGNSIADDGRVYFRIQLEKWHENFRECENPAGF